MPFLRFLFHNRVWIHWYGSQQFFTFSRFMEMVFGKTSFIGEHSQHFQICEYSIIFRKFPGFLGILFGNFSGFLGGTLTI